MRTKGSKNLKTQRVEDLIKTLLDKCLDTVLDDINALRPSERVSLVKDLLPYLASKKRSESLVTLDTLTDSQSEALINQLLNE